MSIIISVEITALYPRPDRARVYGGVAKTLHQPPLILTNNLIQKYGISLCLDHNLSSIVSEALCKAFMDGHAQGKRIRKFVDLTERCEDQNMCLIGRIINTHAKPDHLAVLNYLT